MEKQTGIKVEDRRAAGDTTIKLNVNKATFWQVLDAIAAQAGGIVEYHNSKGISLQKRPDKYVDPPVAYDGIFRATIRQVRSQLLQDVPSSVYFADVEIAWEPRFRGFRVDFHRSDILLDDDKDRKYPPEGTVGGTPRESKRVEEAGFVRFDVMLGSIDRAVLRLKGLKFPLKIVGATRMETFAFDKTLKDAKGAEITRDGVTVKVSNVQLAGGHWTVVMSLEYPPGGPEFESFESWLIYNELSLRSKDGDKTFPNNDNYYVESSSSNRAVIAYHFKDKGTETDPNKLRRGNPEDWKPVYKVPARIVDVPATFDFKGIRLP